jgi:hypothetical protein
MGHAGSRAGIREMVVQTKYLVVIAFSRTGYTSSALNIRQEIGRPERAGKPHGRWFWLAFPPPPGASKS